jgi:hypothetical protein
MSIVLHLAWRADQSRHSPWMAQRTAYQKATSIWHNRKSRATPRQTMKGHGEMGADLIEVWSGIALALLCDGPASCLRTWKLWQAAGPSPSRFGHQPRTSVLILWGDGPCPSSGQPFRSNGSLGAGTRRSRGQRPRPNPTAVSPWPDRRSRDPLGDSPPMTSWTSRRQTRPPFPP